MKTVLIASGTSENKKKFAVETISAYLKKKGISDVKVVAENVYTVNVEAVNPDVIVLIGPNTLKATVPVIQGVPFITRLAAQMDAACEEIIAKLDLG